MQIIKMLFVGLFLFAKAGAQALILVTVGWIFFDPDTIFGARFWLVWGCLTGLWLLLHRHSWKKNKGIKLHLAIDSKDWSDEEILDLIKQDGPGAVTARDHDGNTPLHIAARCNRDILVGSLVYLGADINAKNNAGATPLDWALASKSRDAAVALYAIEDGCSFGEARDKFEDYIELQGMRKKRQCKVDARVGAIFEKMSRVAFPDGEQQIEAEAGKVVALLNNRGSKDYAKDILVHAKGRVLLALWSSSEITEVFEHCVHSVYTRSQGRLDRDMARKVVFFVFDSLDLVQQNSASVRDGGPA